MLRDYGDAKRIAVLAALVHAARAKARDDVAEMFCRRVATLTKRARVELQALKEQQAGARTGREACWRRFPEWLRAVSAGCPGRRRGLLGFRTGIR